MNKSADHPKDLITAINAQIAEVTKEEFEYRKNRVLSVHHNMITRLTVKKHGKDVEQWQTRCNGFRPRCLTYEQLIDKLFQIYFPNDILEQPPDCADYRFITIFTAAEAVKLNADGAKKETIRRDWILYNKHFKQWSSCDIRKISTEDIKQFILAWCKTDHPTTKKLYAVKGIFNTVFNYACAPEHRFLFCNPVPASNAGFKKYCIPDSRKPENKAFQPYEIEEIKIRAWTNVHSCYDIYSYAALFSISTGVREGEIASLKWSDIYFDLGYIHIHSQQNIETDDNGQRLYYYSNSTKDEKGFSKGGRKIPLFLETKKVLTALMNHQKRLDICSEWVFCLKSGEWCKTSGYETALRRLTKGFALHNNHAFRMAFNSYVLVPAGLTVAERAAILGHSPEVNERFYTFSTGDAYLAE